MEESTTSLSLANPLKPAWWRSPSSKTEASVRTPPSACFCLAPLATRPCAGRAQTRQARACLGDNSAPREFSMSKKKKGRKLQSGRDGWTTVTRFNASPRDLRSPALRAMASDWCCRSCGFSNRHWRTACKQCGSLQKEQTKPGAVDVKKGKGKGKVSQQQLQLSADAASRFPAGPMPVRPADAASHMDTAGSDELAAPPTNADGHTEAQKLVRSLQTQIDMVKKLVEVATGEHRAHQQVAQAGLEKQLELARSQVRDAKAPAQRRRELESAISTVSDKLRNNIQLLDKAKAQVEVYAGYVASQRGRLEAAQKELDAIPLVTAHAELGASVVSSPVCGSVAQLESLLLEVQNKLAAARAEHSPATTNGRHVPTSSVRIAEAVGSAPFGAVITAPVPARSRIVLPEDLENQRRARSASPGRGMSTATQRRLFGA